MSFPDRLLLIVKKFLRGKPATVGMPISEIEKRFRATLDVSRAVKSRNLRAYISSVLTSAKDAHGERLFRAVSRGHYRHTTQRERGQVRRERHARLEAALRWRDSLPEAERKHLDTLGLEFHRARV